MSKQIRVTAFITVLAIVALSIASSGCIRIPQHSQNFQATLGGGTFGGATISVPAVGSFSVTSPTTVCTETYTEVNEPGERLEDSPYELGCADLTMGDATDAYGRGMTWMARPTP